MIPTPEHGDDVYIHFTDSVTRVGGIYSMDLDEPGDVEVRFYDNDSTLMLTVDEFTGCWDSQEDAWNVDLDMKDPTATPESLTADKLQQRIDNALLWLSTVDHCGYTSPCEYCLDNAKKAYEILKGESLRSIPHRMTR